MSEDLRVIKTKGYIKNAFLELLKEKNYAKVSVKDIASLASINRNTFYLHYSSKDDLVSSLVNEVNYDTYLRCKLADCGLIKK